MFDDMDDEERSNKTFAGGLESRRVYCPYCGESIEVLIDVSELELSYIEDCSVCCRPITFLLSEGWDGEVQVTLYTNDDVI